MLNSTPMAVSPKFGQSYHRPSGCLTIAGLSAFLTVGGHGTEGKPKSVAFSHLTGRTVVILMSGFAATTGPWWGSP